MESKSDKTIKNLNRRARAARRKLDRGSKKVSRHVNTLVRDRLDNLHLIRKKVVIWLFALVVLIGLSVAQLMMIWQSNEVTAAVNGGTYAEGVVDKITTLNPIFATTETEKAASNLLYSGLFSYDSSSHLSGNLASTWSSNDGKTWYINLRKNANWSDGKQITADDVIFTMNLIKNATVDSPLYSTFSQDTVTKVNSYEVKFTLPSAYMSFPYSLTFGILPQHSLDNISSSNIRNFLSTDFSRNVVSGPFKYSSQETLPNGQSLWQFAPNSAYDSVVHMQTLTIRTYASEKDLVAGLNDGEINAASGVSVSDAVKTKSNQTLSQTTISDGVFAIFNLDSPAVSDSGLRKALLVGADRSELRSSATDNSSKLKPVEPLDAPIAKGIYSSVDAMKQASFSAKSAASQLDALGWKLGANGIREKDGKSLTLNIVTIAGTDYAPVAQDLAKQWKKLGIDAQVTEADQSTADDDYLSSRNYDVLVYDLHLGADPDESAYWSSNQSESGNLNFANFSDRRVDLALAGGQKQTDPTAREARYDDFVERWMDNVPAIALYQPRYYTITVNPIRAFSDSSLVDSSVRFAGVSGWTILSGPLNKTP